MPKLAKQAAGVLAWMLGITATGSAPELSSTEVYQRAVRSVVALEVTTPGGEQFVGAAFVVGQSNVAATAWHLVKDAASLRGKYADGTAVEVSLCGVEDELHDLALLRISPATAPPLPLSVPQPPVASRVYAIGSPRGYAFSITDGLLSQVHSIDGFPQYQLSCPFSPGNSGGPVLNSAGEVIGVSSWSKIGGQNLNFAVPARFVAELCDRDPTECPRVPMPTSELLAGTSNTVPPVTGRWTSGGVGAPNDAFADFRQLLGVLRGHRARIEVSAAGLSNAFEFLVPADWDRPPAPDGPTAPTASRN